MVWLALVLATVFSWATSTGHGDIGLRNTAIIAVALFKARFVALDFMEVRTAPIALRFFVEAWAMVVAGILIAMVANQNLS